MAKPFLSISAKDLIEEMQRFKGSVEEGLKIAVQSYASDMVYQLADATPLGDPVRYLELYRWRQREYGFKVEQGLAKGNWRVLFANNSNTVVQEYDKSAKNPYERAFNRMEDYKLGSNFYIVNNAPYIGRLNEGQSIQAPSGFIDRITESFKSGNVYELQFYQYLTSKGF